MKKTKEEQYSYLLELEERKLGLMMNRVWDNDPKRLSFVLSRYKFVSKMLKGKKSVLEIGAADGFKSRIVSTEVGKLDLSDVTLSSKEQYQLSHLNKNKYFASYFLLHGFLIFSP